MVKARKATTKEDIDRLVVGGGGRPSSAKSEKAEEDGAAKDGAAKVNVMQPCIKEAPSNRSKCKACNGPIAMGAKRVGVPGRANGVSTMFWCHPKCFIEHCINVDVAPTSRATCKADGKAISKGEPRLLLGYRCAASIGACVIYRPENAAKTILPDLRVLAKVPKSSIKGLKDLPTEHRARVEKLILGEK
jgi:hypothetical protein